MRHRAPRIAPDTFEKVVEGKKPLNTFFGFTKTQLEAVAALGFKLYEQGQTREAELVFKGLIALDANSPFGYAGLGAIALREEKLDRALEHLRKAADLRPDDATIRANLGEALLRQAKFQEAAAEFQRALSLDPAGRDSGANRARAIITGMKALIKAVRSQGRGGTA